MADGDNVTDRPAAPGETRTDERGVVARAVLKLPLTSVAYYLARAGLSRARGFEDVFNRCRGAWTYDSGSSATDAHYRDIAAGQEQHLATCVKGAGAPLEEGSASNIQRAIDRAEARMTELHDLLQARGIGLSVMVYPWPGQLHHDDRDSRQVRIWRDWCATRCAHFIDAFPDFFAHKAAQPRTWYRDLYVAGDVHFNERGNAMLAAGLASAFQDFGR